MTFNNVLTPMIESFGRQWQGMHMAKIHYATTNMTYYEGRAAGWLKTRKAP